MKTFLSIGSGPGIGIATAERFAREGYRVVLSARDVGKTEALSAGLRAKSFEADAHKVDAGDDASIATLVSKVEAAYGSIEVLHYNAAILRQQGVSDQPGDTFNADLAVNIGGALSAIKAVERGMAIRGAGTILLTGGGFALAPDPRAISLSIGKAGLRTLALGLFPELKAKGVHVAVLTVMAMVAPGSAEAAEVAEHFWRLHVQPAGGWEVEATYKS